MGRGLRLACEECDFRAELRERAPFALDAAGHQVPLVAEQVMLPNGHWVDWLCGECRLPVRLVAGAEMGTAGTPSADGKRTPICPRCGSALMDFETAQRELAAASRSRLWLDLAAERQALALLEEALAEVGLLWAALERGDQTTTQALEELARRVTVEAPAPGGHPAAEMLATTTALVDLRAELADAADLGAAARLLRARAAMSERYAAQLEGSALEEEHLPGVPCPHCGVGHLIHWPFWE